MTNLILISGARGSGKNTVADLAGGYLAHEGKSVLITSFAAKLKAAAARSLGYNGSEDELVELMNDCKENWTFTVTGGDRPVIFSGREYLQHFGTEGGRETYGRNFWVDLVLPNPGLGEGWGDVGGHMVDQVFAGYDYVFVTDCRFENEAARGKSLGGTIWEVQRPGTSKDIHASEAPLPVALVDKYIVNDADIDVLATRVEALLA